MLDKYREKRDFTKTPEPAGRKEKDKEKSLTFVVHKHKASRLHWDLRLELEGVLKSWAIPKGPSLNPAEKKLAVMVEDHPIEYGQFEGVIPEGNYGAGPVMIWDRGTYHGVSEADRQSSESALLKGLAKGHLSFVLEGERLKGEFALVKLKRGKENSWLLIKKNDEFARAGNIADENTSVATGRTMDEISQNAETEIDLGDAPEGPMPAHVKPMAATLVQEPFDRAGWLFEIKWDGYRALAEIIGGRVRLYSRNGKSYNERFGPIAESLQTLPFDALLDGEVVAVDESGKANFQLLQNYLRNRRGNLVYYVFDLLYFRGHDLRKLPLARRKSILKQVLPTLSNVRFSDHVEDEGVALFKAARENDIEGIIAKDGRSPYKPGRRGPEWLKIKTHHRQEAIIGGFTVPRGGRKGLGALVLGVYEDGELRYIGHTGGGFTDEQLVELRAQLETIATKKSPFRPPPKTNMPVTWVEPKLVCEVRFSEWTDEGLMRQPVFLGLRDDLDPRNVGREKENPLPAAAGHAPAVAEMTRHDERLLPKKRSALIVVNDEKVELTNLDKVFWPDEGYTKGDLIDYYRRISPFILPYLKDRPEALHRFPDGISGEGFFQKNVDRQVPSWIETVKVRSETENKDTVYLLCQDAAALIYMANLGCIEINPWHSTVPHLEEPDYLVLDLDPMDIPFKEVVRAATVTHEVLAEIGAENYCKTSGATGLHIYVPLGARYSHDEAIQFAKLVNLLVHTRLPDTTSVERNPEKRRKRVYLDFLQNGRGQTLAAPYCVRPRKGATVSTPLKWEEVNDELDPARFTMKTIGRRLSRVGDLWQAVLAPGIDMVRCLRRLEDLVEEND